VPFRHNGGLINLTIVVEPGKDRHAFTCRLAELAQHDRSHVGLRHSW
jgi:hypothetical protein